MSDTNTLNSSSADSLPSTDGVNSVDISTCAGEDTASSSVPTNEEANGSTVNGADSVPESCDGKVTDEDGVTRKISKKNSKPSNQTFKMRVSEFVFCACGFLCFSPGVDMREPFDGKFMHKFELYVYS